MRSFRVICRDERSDARRGVLTTAHGEVQTPAFMPVGTSGAVKGIMPQQLEETGADIILGNTYHLLLRPGVDVVQKLGGLHKLMGWNKAILTDSGGYQVFSLNSLVKIDDDGVELRDPRLKGRFGHGACPELLRRRRLRVGRLVHACG